MIFNYLIVKYFLILKLLKSFVNFFGDLEVPNSLILFILWTIISLLVQNAFIVHSLFLDLWMKSLYFITQLGGLVIG